MNGTSCRELAAYDVSKAITEHIQIGEKYDNVKKVYSINILYFDLGKGNDYLYHGKTVFTGVHTGDRLIVNTREANEIKMSVPENIFPEYYIIRVNEFNEVAKTPLEEWLDYLKNNRISETTTTPGLREARERLLYMTMTDEERRAYDAHLDNIMVQNDVLDTAKLEGREEGLKEGRAEGRKEGIIVGREKGRVEGLEEGRKEGRTEGREEGKTEACLANARKMKQKGYPLADIAEITGLTEEEIAEL